MNLVQKMNEAFSEELRTRPFPVERLSHSWRVNAERALILSSPPQLGISNEMMIRLINLEPCSKGYNLSFLEFATLSNNMEACSMHKLAISPSEYTDLLAESACHVEYYSAQIDTIRNEVQRRFADEEKMREATEKGAAGDKSFMKPVKAEA